MISIVTHLKPRERKGTRCGVYRHHSDSRSLLVAGSSAARAWFPDKELGSVWKLIYGLPRAFRSGEIIAVTNRAYVLYPGDVGTLYS